MTKAKRKLWMMGLLFTAAVAGCSRTVCEGPAPSSELTIQIANSSALTESSTIYACVADSCGQQEFVQGHKSQKVTFGSTESVLDPSNPHAVRVDLRNEAGGVVLSRSFSSTIGSLGSVGDGNCAQPSWSGTVTVS